MTKIIAITGGIGSGKTTLSNYLKNKGFLVHESDRVVSNMYTTQPKPFISYVKKNISNDVIKNNKIIKKEITNLIFNNKVAKINLEKYIHKEVERSRASFLKKNTNNKKKVIFADIPLLLEKKLEKKFDLVVCVISSKNNRKKRLLKNKKFTEQTIKKIFKLQTNDKERRGRSHIIINNNKSKKEFVLGIEKALKGILQ